MPPQPGAELPASLGERSLGLLMIDRILPMTSAPRYYKNQSQQHEDQLLQMFYEMRELMKEHHEQSDREGEQMALDCENIFRE